MLKFLQAYIHIVSFQTLEMHEEKRKIQESHAQQQQKQSIIPN